MESYDKNKVNNMGRKNSKGNLDVKHSHHNISMDTGIGFEEWDNLYFYDGDDLGNVYSADQTRFRLWAPTASEVKLVMYKGFDDNQGKEMAMKHGEKGTWTANLLGNQNGLVYRYKVKIKDKWNEVVDPYVRAVTVNGDRGVVIDLVNTNPANWAGKRFEFQNPEDAIIYEIHIRDLSIHSESGIVHKGKYLGISERGTTGPRGVKTGLDHMKDLGVTHVQLLPMFDYYSVDETKLDHPQFNWGYDPKNYNVPEGSYSTNPYEPAVRINEMKQMIQALQDEGLGVIMDVVYNHMYSIEESNFNKIVPGYYYRYHADGTPSNGSGVGNDTASERKMMRKFIVDSVTFWATEYHVNGFRFDLMGIHDVETMNAVRKALDKIDPSIIILGEGWDLNTLLAPNKKANQKNAEHMPRIAHFNDIIRDSLKGSIFEVKEKGFVNGMQDMENNIKRGIEGGLKYPSTMATYKDPGQVVSYVESHDNNTLWDKLLLTNPDVSEANRKKMHKLASSVILTSQGIAFIHAGQEFMRSKKGDENSYKSPDTVNQLDWNRRAEYDVEVEYMKGLIALRKNFSCFRMATAEDIEKNLTFLAAPKNVVVYLLTNAESSSQLVVIHNANEKAITTPLPKSGKWSVLVNGETAGIHSIAIIQGDHVTVPAISTFVMIDDLKT